MKITYLIVLFSLVFTGCSENKENVLTNELSLIHNEAEQKIDVLVDGKLFTSYLYTDTLATLKKTVLYPIISANGITITRGYPLDSRPGESTDHPHHIGAWLNYGDVNGFDYWNNSDAIPEEQKGEMGVIRHEKIIDFKSGNAKGELMVTANWLKPDGTVLLKESTHFVFHAKDSIRIIDRITTLTALNDSILFKDNKEGMIGIRLARQLEHPSNKPITLSDAHGNKAKIAVVDTTGVTGHYLSSEGIEGLDVWGKRAKWVALSSIIGSKNVNVIIMDSPDNVGYPTYWHARGYGLFAANPLGQKIFSDGKEALNYSLNPTESVTFSYRIEIIDGKSSKEQLEAEYQKFIKK